MSVDWRSQRRHMWHARAHAQDGATALMLAAGNGRVDCVRLLLDAGADTNATTNVRATSVWGVAFGVVRQLLLRQWW